MKALTDQGHNISDNDLIDTTRSFSEWRNALGSSATCHPVPEGRLNLVIYYLRNDEIQEAFDLKDLSTTPQSISRASSTPVLVKLVVVGST